jgi:hypothetical protein
MSKESFKPKSRREHDQMKREKMSNKKPVSDNKLVSNNESIIGKCKKFFKKESSED